MTGSTSIEWADANWNPTTGCTKISPGCDGCYAEAFSPRLQKMGGKVGHKYRNGFEFTIHPDDVNWPFTVKKPKRIFANSMSDFGHEKMPVEFFALCVDTMAACWWHTFQVLTKRPAGFKELLRKSNRELPPNVMLGVSIEDQKRLFRLKVLKEIPARWRFISYEPALEGLGKLDLAGIDWVIAGGESGLKARPPRAEWFREIRDETQRQGVAFFFKQWGGRWPKQNGNVLDGMVWDQFPATREEVAQLARKARIDRGFAVL